MEFMDRRKRSLLVQFWLTVESFKNPLESVDSGSDNDDDDPIRDPSLTDTLKEDILMMNELYFSGPATDPALSVISQKHVRIIRSFGVEEDPPTTSAEKRVRRSVMLAQRQVEREMEQQDFEDFQRSELWFHVVADSELSESRGSGDVTPVRASTTMEEGHGQRVLKTRSETAPAKFGTALGFFHLQEPSTSSVVSQTGTPVQGAGPRSSPSDLEVLMSPAATGGSSSTRAPLFDDPEDAKFDAALEAHSQRMEAIQAALTDIIALDQHEASQKSVAREGSLSDSAILSAPSIGGRSVSGETRVDPQSDDEGDIDDRRGDGDDQHHSSFQLAGPGDLHLSYEIARLSDKVTSLQTQEGMLDTLIKKAELTGDEQELQLLQKSKSSLARDLRELNFQKTQYEQQESANRLVSDRTKIAIVNSTVGEESGKSVVRYLIEVQQLASDGSFASGWVVARRYNEFFNMHTKLRERYALVRSLDFPGKRLVTSLSNSFVDSRRTALEKYMQVREVYDAICYKTNTAEEPYRYPSCVRECRAACLPIKGLAIHGCATPSWRKSSIWPDRPSTPGQELHALYVQVGGRQY